jgi:hypothetical protein
MGYESRHTGEITFDPPLKWAWFKDNPAADPQNGRRCSVKFVIQSENTETEDGVLSVRSAVAVAPLTDDSYTAYDMQEHLQSAVDAALAGNHRVTFGGRIDAMGPDGDQWRFKVVAGRVERFEPVLVWPDEAED